jgi:hypothetical protein
MGLSESIVEEATHKWLGELGDAIGHMQLFSGTYKFDLSAG